MMSSLIGRHQAVALTAGDSRLGAGGTRRMRGATVLRQLSGGRAAMTPGAPGHPEKRKVGSSDPAPDHVVPLTCGNADLRIAAASGPPREDRKTVTVRETRSRQPKPLAAGAFQGIISSFQLHLAAEGKSGKTVRTYTEAVQWFAAAHLLRETGHVSWEEACGQNIQRWMGSGSWAATATPTPATSTGLYSSSSVGGQKKSFPTRWPSMSARWPAVWRSGMAGRSLSRQETVCRIRRSGCSNRAAWKPSWRWGWCGGSQWRDG